MLGYGWDLTGLSRLYRCIVGLSVDATAVREYRVNSNLLSETLEGSGLTARASTFAQRASMAIA